MPPGFTTQTSTPMMSVKNTPTDSRTMVMEYQKNLNNLFGAGLKVDGYYGPKTHEAVSNATIQTAKNNPAVVEKLGPALQTQSFEDAYRAVEGGDISQLRDAYGQPFSKADQQAALKKAQDSTKLFYEAQSKYDKANTESALKQRQLDYQNYLATSGEKFQDEKTGQDQTAADQGVLFSGGRYQKLQNLQKGYERDQAYQQSKYGADISNTARDYQYKYGDKAAGSLSQYYQLGGNTYNPNVATGGVGAGRMSDVYNPKGMGFQGTANTARSAEEQRRAAGLLWNKGNKLLSTGYQNKF